MPTLYIVGTPIGNLEDVTLRSLRILKEVDLIVCEDTRVTKKLLLRHDIKTPVESYHAQSTLKKTDKILALLGEGKNLALVSDAGTPTISDPGVKLVALVRERFGDEVSIVAIPGPSAVVAALSISGVPASEFLFLGFLPHKKGRQTLFGEIAKEERTVVFCESPHRLMKTLSSLAEHLSENRLVVVAKELTKIHEEVIRGTAKEVMAYLESNPDKVRGEFVIVVSGA
ncbi:MAG: 16S rRNA (cytidine(1402)-2'-O)-methyltransferase [Parcubacteria group bacterium]|nr:16S rRNA (cytidine(1402)-2'-O)-methyltransferase [Parcubacteria group bacterium]